ncbi:MAG: hypothetical protein KDK78_06985 [Chlamydiia bacterium]|nr:hypothetical protein [Chlamydiia bacterium]
MRLMRGLYLVPPPFNQQIPHPYAFAQSICSPSYISFESSLEYHGLIPEVSHVIQCATSKRSRSFANVLAEYRYTHIPGGHLYMGVERIATDEATFFMANPWKALADHYYVRRRPWSGLEDAMEDLRIDREDLLATDLGVLQELAEHYPVVRVRKMLKCWMRGL